MKVKNEKIVLEKQKIEDEMEDARIKLE